MIRWTCDLPSAHTTGKMPLLDIQIWVTENETGTVTNYEFYHKLMSNPVSIPSESALSNGVKFATHRQEVIRILRNTSIHLPWSVKAKYLWDFSCKQSGYGEGFRIQVLCGGITGHLKKLDLCTTKIIPFNRPMEEIVKLKKLKKTCSCWFCGKDQEQSVKSVLVLPCTSGSKLVRKIREHTRKKLSFQSGGVSRKDIGKYFGRQLSLETESL